MKLKSLQFSYSGEDDYPFIPYSVNQHTIMALPNFYTHQNDILPFKAVSNDFRFYDFYDFFSLMLHECLNDTLNVFVMVGSSHLFRCNVP